MALCVRSFPPDWVGGGEAYALELYNRLRASGQVSLITGVFRGGEGLPPGAERIALRSGTRFSAYRRYHKASRAVLRRKRPDIVHATCIEAATAGIPAVLTSHHVAHLLVNPEHPLRAALQRALAKPGLRRFGRIICVSKATQRDIVALGYPEEHTRVIYQGVDPTRFFFPSTETSRREILVPSRFVRSKGQDVVARAFRLIPEGVRRDWSLRFMGFPEDPAFVADLRGACASLPATIETGLSEADYAARVRETSIVVFPTLQPEGFGRVICEAMACGKPAVATDQPVLREVGAQGCVFFERGNEKALARELEGLMVDGERARALGEQGRKLASKAYDWDAAFPRILDVYRELLDGNNGGAAA